MVRGVYFLQCLPTCNYVGPLSHPLPPSRSLSRARSASCACCSFSRILARSFSAADMGAVVATMNGLKWQYSTDVHAALNTTSLPEAAVMQAIFWTAGSVVFDGVVPVWNVTVSHPCMVVVETDTSGATVTASNPNTPSLPLTLFVPGELYGDGCTPGNGSTRIDMVLPQYFGNSTSITCLYAA